MQETLKLTKSSVCNPGVCLLRHNFMDVHNIGVLALKKCMNRIETYTFSPFYRIFALNVLFFKSVSHNGRNVYFVNNLYFAFLSGYALRAAYYYSVYKFIAHFAS